MLIAGFIWGCDGSIADVIVELRRAERRSA